MGLLAVGLELVVSREAARRGVVRHVALGLAERPEIPTKVRICSLPITGIRDASCPSARRVRDQAAVREREEGVLVLVWRRQGTGCAS